MIPAIDFYVYDVPFTCLANMALAASKIVCSMIVTCAMADT